MKVRCQEYADAFVKVRSLFNDQTILTGDWVHLEPLFTAREKWHFYRYRREVRLKIARQIATHTKMEWLHLLERMGSRCARCLRSERICKDHVHPIWDGGSDGIDNLQPLCVWCNTGKALHSFHWANYRLSGNWLPLSAEQTADRFYEPTSNHTPT